jgi:transcriptional regulator with XRE-family HTH domain
MGAGGPEPQPPFPPLPPQFGPALREGRRRSGVTQEALFRRLFRRGMSLTAATISAYENGRSVPRPSSTILACEEEIDLDPGTLLVRLPRATRDAETRELFARWAPGRFDYVVDSVSETFDLDDSLLVDRIEIELGLRALVDISEPAYYFTYEESERQRIAVEPVSGCAAGNSRPLMPERLERRIPLLGGPLRRGERRTITYAVRHAYRDGFRPGLLRYRRNTTHLLRSMTLTVRSAGRAQVEFGKWPERYAEQMFREGSGLLDRSGDPTMTWTDPTEAAYGFCWRAR